MSQIKLRSNAKINLALDVVGKREDGYHYVDMIMQSVDLHDYITINEINKGIIITCDNENVPLDNTNIVYKAVEFIKDKFDIKLGVHVDIQKNIPIAAGLAGGSSNCAASIVGLNKLWNLGMTNDEMKQIGLALGADVPFCIEGGTARATGIGEKLTKLDCLNNLNIIICKPDIFVSTAWAYSNIDMHKVEKRPDIDCLIECIQNHDIQAIAKGMTNVFEGVTEKEYVDITNIKIIMMKNGAVGAMMSGSGPSVFGIYDDFDKAKLTKAELEKQYGQTYLVKTCKGGVEIER